MFFLERYAVATQTPPVFEGQMGIAAGWPPGLSDTGPAVSTTAEWSAVGFVRLRFPRYTPFGLELNVVPGYGAGANLITDALRVGCFRWHLLDIGLFRNFWKPVSVSRVNRQWDVTFGTGLEARLWHRAYLTLDWRVFMPNPYRVLTDYGDFSRLVYIEALKGGQAWLGVAWSY
jgi:hypothetical protein